MDHTGLDGLSRLEELGVGRNNLTVPPGFASPSITKLLLGKNRITTLGPNAFA